LERARRASRSTSPLKRGARYRVKRCVIPLTQRHARRGVSGYATSLSTMILLLNCIYFLFIQII